MATSPSPPPETPPPQRPAPPLPRPGQRNVLVTSALPYVNNYPHLGNIIGAVLSADVYARYLRQRAVNVIYVCGTDEYGTATETKAQQERVSPRQICDKYHALHKAVYDWFDIAFDVFGRTSTPTQTHIVQEIFWDVYNNGYVQEDTIVQLYCDAVCKRFLADRYVHGACPNCGYDDARGDQCDSCGRMLNPSELLQPKCSTCGNHPVSKSTRHLFLDLPKIEPQLAEWFETASQQGKWTTNALAMTETWLRDGLRQRCITRDLKWGVPVPLEAFKDKVFYVWFDAPVGYPSITAALCGDGWRKWWIPEEKDNVDIKLVQFMGKDNVPFHTIVWPGALLATQKPWTKLHHISTTDYLNYETGKFSKSRGVGVFGNDAIDTGIPCEVWRYYLLLNRPEGSDAVFTWDDLAAKNNDELIKTLGNYINRTVSFLSKSFAGIVPELIQDDEENIEFTSKINVELQQYITLLEKVSLKAGLKKAMAIASLGNQYLTRKAPWKLFKEGETRAAGSSLAFSANLVVLVALVLEPFLGYKFSRKVFEQLGLEHQPGVNNIIPDMFEPNLWLKTGMKTGVSQILFTALTKDQIAAFRTKYGGQQNEVAEDTDQMSEKGFTLDLRVGKVVDVKDHEESDRLFIARVDVGEEKGPRTVVAGLRDVYSADELRGERVILVCNLAPAMLAGIASEGMILVADKKKKVKVLTVKPDVEVGGAILPHGMSVTIGSQPLDRKAFQNASKLLRVGKDSAVVFDKQFKLVCKSDPTIMASAQGIPEGGKIK
ncbi:methionine--tRNA ligase, cytoplasmic [Chondrus crispus]|uniref:methionine--tRNA ligase n=1 Tax=Chondrus crispus TaxID=2769 RepID=R7QCZ2_CHOCR|nr:methionine--tRNA ligase, cytoplasmic [Chondrus crispus]CDF35301.1 methionine--tRNA ligase, cytoplasmic [Chondrus crispus]|eukprot:XP_005715120.1 methionine--tRNA ligase, cytoplasmic [Chondrus crispus]